MTTETARNCFGSTINNVWYEPEIPSPYRAGHVPGVIGIPAWDLPTGGNF